MKRVLLTSAALATVPAVLFAFAFVLFRIGTISTTGAIYGALFNTIINAWVIMFAVYLVFNAIEQRRRKRLAFAFDIQELSGGSKAFRRTVQLRCPPDKFLKCVALKIAHD